MKSSLCLLDSFTEMVTIISSLLIIAFVAFVIVSHFAWHRTSATLWILAAIVTLLPLIAMLFCPRQVVTDDHGIHIQLIGGTIDIDAQNIDYVEPLPIDEKTCRICGAGHYFGNLGLFKGSTIGYYYSLVADGSKTYIIHRKNGLPVAVSVENGEIF